jgi:hypothetical protein
MTTPFDTLQMWVLRERLRRPCESQVSDLLHMQAARRALLNHRASRARSCGGMAGRVR